MNVFELMASIKLDTKDYSKGLSDASSKTSSVGGKLKSVFSGIGSVAKTTLKVATSAFAGVSAGVVALGKIGVDYNKQMETYTTNFTTMLGNSEKAIQKVNELKKFAASTPLSMDDLAQGTQTLLAFGVESEKSTEILRQLGDIALGNADKMQRLSTAFGKANAQGKLTGETVQQMIDAGWNPLIEISKKTGESMDEVRDRMSKGQITVDELSEAMKRATSEGGQFAGGMESASKTLEGLTSTLQDNAKALAGQLFEPISEGLRDNVLPEVIDVIGQMSSAFEEGGFGGLANKIAEVLQNLIARISEKAPEIVETVMGLASTMITALVEGLSQNPEAIATTIITLVESLITTVLELLPTIVELGLQLIVSLATGIAESIPELIPTVVEVILQIVETLTNPDTLMQLIDAALLLIMALADGLIEALPLLIEKVPIIIGNLLTAIAEKLPEILAKGVELVVKLASGVIQAIPQLRQAAFDIMLKFIESIAQYFVNLKQKGSELIDKVKEGVSSKIANAATWGKDLIQNFINGILAKWNSLKTTVSNVAQSVKDFLGFSEPKKGPLSNFHTYAPDMIDLFVKGINDNKNRLEDTLKSALSFDMGVMSGTVAYAGNGYGANGTIGNITNNFYGSYSERDSAKFIRSINRRLGAEMR